MRLPPPPLSLFILILALIAYALMIPDLKRDGELLKLRSQTAQVCSIPSCERKPE
jgi:hypothetical protein